MRPRSRLRHLVEYAAVRVGHLAARLLGPVRANAFGRRLGDALFLLSPRHRHRALENLRWAGAADVDGTARGAFRHMVGGAMEAMAVLAAPGRYLGDDGYIRYERLDIVDRLRARGRGVIVALAHLGNWEIAGLASPRRGYPLISVARTMKNPYVQEFLSRARGVTGGEIIPKKGAGAAMSEVLRRGGLLVMLCDQRWRNGAAVEFFGRPAATVTTPAVLSLRHGAPILPMEIYRAGRRPYHRVICTEPFEPEAYRRRAHPVIELTQDLTKRLEEFIRRHPDQWLWMHNRWRTWSEDRRGRAGI